MMWFRELSWCACRVLVAAAAAAFDLDDGRVPDTPLALKGSGRPCLQECYAHSVSSGVLLLPFILLLYVVGI